MSISLDRSLLRLIGWISLCLWMAACQSMGIEPTFTATAQVTSTSSPIPTPTEIVATPEPTATKLPDVQGEVSIWLDWTEQDLMVLYPHLEAFQERFPEIQISISYFPPDQLLDRYRTAAQENKEPTILIGSTDWSQQLIQDGTIRDIRERVTDDFLESFHPVALEGVGFNQSIFGLPLSMDGILLYRNRSLISEAPATLDDLVNLTQQLEGEDLIGIQLDLGFLQTGAFLETCGGELLDVNGELSLTLSAGECWLKILQQFRLAGSVTIHSDDDLQRFEAGQAAWLVDGSWNSARIMQALGEEQVAIDPWPVYTPTGDQLKGYAWSQNLLFSASATEQDFNAAWILARYLLTPEVQEDFAISTFGQHVPVLKSVPTSERWLQELMIAIGMNISLPRYPEFSIFTKHLELAAIDVARRGYDPYYVIRWVHLNIEKDLRFFSAGGE
jgi:arabinogalactan oligomer/maltooligosaccharide transport system substrate-binding protein